MSALKLPERIESPERNALLSTVAELVGGRPQEGVLRIAVDGVDGAGKTIFADALASMLQTQGRIVIRASVDGFHNPKAVRYMRGRASPVGFFSDSYDYLSLKKFLLDPVSPGGSGKYRTAVFDHASDTRVSAPELEAVSGSILILDGIFLHRSELRRYWDFSIFLDVAFDTSFSRMAVRDCHSPNPEDAENRRYLEGQKLYLKDCNPKQYATIVIDNNDVAIPYIAVADYSPKTAGDGRSASRCGRYLSREAQDTRQN